MELDKDEWNSNPKFGRKAESILCSYEEGAIFP